MSAAFDIDRPWKLSGQVAVRPEPFGALVYDFDTRKLSFLKSRKLLALVQSLGAHSSAQDACRAGGVQDAEMPSYERALATLAASGIITERGTP